MPAVSKKQQKYFGYLLSNPEERKKKGISKKAAKDFASDVQEVAPPGWGHTKAEKEKTKPDKPKSEIGGSAAAFKRALDDGRFKGLPGDKTKKEKTASMFKLMWSMKKKGAKPHYKPGTDKKYEKYQTEDLATDAEKYRVPRGPGGNPIRMGDKVRSMKSSHPLGQLKVKYGADKVREYYKKNKAVGEEVEEALSPMKDNNLFGNAYAGSYETLKKKIGSKKKHNKPAIQEDFRRFMADAQAARDRQAKKIEDRKKKDAQFVDTKQKGVRFYDKKGKGRIKSGKKIYDK